MKRCPHCDKELADTAVKCRYCKQRVSGLKENNQAVKSRAPLRKTAFIIFIILLGGILYLKLNSGQESYTNQTYQIKIRHPKEWKVFDLNNYYYIYKGIASAVIPDDSEVRLICAFSCSKDLKRLNPLITVAVQPIAEQQEDLAAEELLKFIEQGLDTFVASGGRSAKELPSVYAIGSRKFVRYTATQTAQDKEWENTYYYFVKDGKLYIISLSAEAGSANRYKKVTDDIVASIRVYG